eukprot:730-Chlamydomonas_euryale.AAC.10
MGKLAGRHGACPRAGSALVADLPRLPRARRRSRRRDARALLQRGVDWPWALETRADGSARQLGFRGTWESTVVASHFGLAEPYADPARASKRFRLEPIYGTTCQGGGHRVTRQAAEPFVA